MNDITFLATLVKEYGKPLYENGIPENEIFSKGNYGTLITTALTMEIYINDEFNKEWNKQWNKQSPMPINP